MADQTELIVVKKPLWGKFKLPYGVGQKIEIETKLAGELVSNGFAEKAKKAAPKMGKSAEKKNWFKR